MPQALAAGGRGNRPFLSVPSLWLELLVTRPAQERRARPNDSIVMGPVTDPVRGLSDGEEVVLGAPPSSRRGVPLLYASVMGRPSRAPGRYFRLSNSAGLTPSTRSRRPSHE